MSERGSEPGNERRGASSAQQANEWKVQANKQANKRTNKQTDELVAQYFRLYSET